MMKVVMILLILLSYGYGKVYDIKEIYNLSFVNSEDYEIASLQKEVASKGIEKSFSSFYPKVEIESEYSKVNEFPVFIDGIEEERRDRRTDVTFSFEQVLYDKSKYLDFKDKKLLFNQAHLEKEKAKQQLIFDVTKYYFETLMKLNQLHLIEQKIKRFEKILERSKYKYKSGFISKADYLEALSQKEELLTQELQYRLEYNKTKSFLEKLTGMKNIEVKSKIKLTNINNHTLSSYLNDFDENIDFKVQKLKVNRAIISEDLALSQFEPRFLLTYEHKSNDIPETENQKKIALVFSLNIFNGFYDLKNYEEVKIQKLIEKSNLNKLIKDIKQEIDNKISEVNTFYKIILKYPKIIETKEFALEGMRERFNVGTKSIIDLLDEENKYFEKLNKFTEYKYQFIIEYTTLHFFTNRLNEDFLNEINGFVYE